MWIRKNTFIIFILLVTCFCSCKKEVFEETANKRMIGTDNAFVLETRYKSHAGKDLYIEMDVGAFFGGMAYNDKFRNDSAFKNESANGFNIEVQEVQRIDLKEDKSYANLVLVDLSDGVNGTWKDFDIFNLRNRALNRILEEGHQNPDNEIGLASFARTGEGATPYKTRRWSEGDAFSQRFEDQARSLFTMYDENTGSNSLYDALDYMIDYTVKHTTNPNKNITIITHSSPDNKNSVSFINIINKAKQAGVKINMISLTNDYTTNMISVALRTGGFVNMVSSTTTYKQDKGGIMDKGTLMLSSIHKVLAHNFYVYRVKLKLTRTSGIWQPKSVAYHYYEISEHYSDGTLSVSNYIPFYVQVP